MDNMNNIDARTQAHRFLTTVHERCSGLLELRIINVKKSCRQCWPGSIDEAVTIALRESVGANVYFGVTPRGRKGGKKQDVAEYPGVWVDLDFKDFPGGEQEVKARLDGFDLKPTILVDSGGGYHGYWLLTEPKPVTPETLPTFEWLNKRFADALGGDSCHDLPHVLRVPGTTNWPDERKRQLGRTPVPVRLLYADGPRYTLEQLDEAVPFIKPQSGSRGAGAAQQKASEHKIVDRSDTTLPPRFSEMLARNSDFEDIWERRLAHLLDQSRNGYDMAMAVRLTRCGFSDLEIKIVLWHMPSGRRKEAREDYLDLTIEKARDWSSRGQLSAVDLADQFLFAKGFYGDDGLTLRWYREQWLRYNGQTYEVIPDYTLEAEVSTYIQLGESRYKSNQQFPRHVIANIRARCHVSSALPLPALEQEADWVPALNHIVVLNGILNLDAVFIDDADQTLFLHTPSFLSTVGLPFPFDAAARSRRWTKFIEEILPDPKNRQLVQEIFGYCLTYDTSLQKFFLFEGSGGNGKSVLLDVLTALLGKDNVSSVPLEAFSSAHGLEETLGKLANIVGDVGELDRVAEGVLKQFTGGDLVYFNPKFKHPFAAKATAKCIIASNVRPPFRDRSQGIWRRLIVVPFPVTIPEEQQKKHLAEELKKELPGILNWAIRGAIRLRQRKIFTEPAGSITAKQEYQREMNPARLFLEDCCLVASGQSIPCSNLYAEYDHFCESNGFKPLNSSHFGREVKSVFPKMTKKKLTRAEDPKRGWVYDGITWQD